MRDLLHFRRTSPGTVLFERGDKADVMYFIEGGRVRIHLSDADGQDVTLAELRRGDFLGEMAILTDAARSAQCHLLCVYPAAYVRFASVEQVPDLLAEGGVLGIHQWNASRSETCSTFLQRPKLLKMFWFGIGSTCHRQ
ncbi:MAG: cyclic nucleotide-binding domain-containing protein [Bryobacteraceae bacterium]